MEGKRRKMGERRWKKDGRRDDKGRKGKGRMRGEVGKGERGGEKAMGLGDKGLKEHTCVHFLLPLILFLHYRMFRLFI